MTLQPDSHQTVTTNITYGNVSLIRQSLFNNSKDVTSSKCIPVCATAVATCPSQSQKVHI